MTAPSPVRRLYDTLASVRLGVVVMTALAVACTVATVYESRHGTAATQRLFYGAPWFSGLLGLLGANVLVSMLKRYPWTRHHVGLVVAHVGILLLLGGSLVSLHAGLDGRMVVSAGESTDRITLPGEALHVELPDGLHATVPVRLSTDPPSPGTRLPVAAGAALVVEQFRPHVRTSEVWAEGTRDRPGRPVLHYRVEGAGQGLEGWLVASDPHQSHVDFGPVLFAFHAAQTGADLQAMTRTGREHNLLSFVLGPGGDLRYALSTRKGRPSAGRVQVGQPVITPWMGLAVTVDRLMPNAVRHRVVAPLPLPRREEDRSPAVRVRLEAEGRSAIEWLAWSEPRRVPLGDGEATLAYAATETTLPFRLTLLEFRSDKYPGTRMAATYESRVRIHDPQFGSSEHLISMNHPLHHRGYTLFQSSYIEGEPMTSIFSVSRSPGLPLVYAGTGLLSVGALWMFWIKSWLARRQASRQALLSGGNPAPRHA